MPYQCATFFMGICILSLASNSAMESFVSKTFQYLCHVYLRDRLWKKTSFIKFKMEEVIVMGDFCSHPHFLFCTNSKQFKRCSHGSCCMQFIPSGTCCIPISRRYRYNGTWSWFEILLIKTETWNASGTSRVLFCL